MQKLQRLFSILLLLCFLVSSAFASEIETNARQAILVDVGTMTVLMEKNAQERMPTSSMSKVITIYEVFQALEDGRLQLTDTLPVSEKAWKKGGSKMFVEVGSEVTVEDLIRGVVIQSGNDATIVLAEGLAGTEDAFAENLNARAKTLGMANSHFTNASGWPDPEHYSTAHDLAILSVRLIQDFPQYYSYFSEKEFTYNGITQANRDPLLYKNIGADGIKTGHTEVAGYGLIGSAVQEGRRLILVVNGLGSETEREQEAVRLLRWGFAEFTNTKLFDSGQKVAFAPVWLGAADQVSLITDRDVSTIVQRGKGDQLKVDAVFDTPVHAPIEKGQRLGTLEVRSGNYPAREYPLFAGEDVPAASWTAQLIAKFKLLIQGDYER